MQIHFRSLPSARTTTGIVLSLAMAFLGQPAAAANVQSTVHDAAAPAGTNHGPLQRQAAGAEDDPDSMYAVGRMLDEGAQGASDVAQAFEWYSRAAQRGHAGAMNQLGLLYSNGRGVRRDYVAAFGWYQQAVARGSLSAVSNLATLYFHGLGVEQSYAAAAKLLETGVREGSPDAQTKLGLLYENGLGVQANPERARELFKIAAHQTYPTGHGEPRSRVHRRNRR